MTPEETMQMKYTAHASLKKTFNDQTMLKLMAVVVNNLLRKDTELQQYEFQDCLKDADSAEKYAQCAMPVILRHQQQRKNVAADDEKREPVSFGFDRGGDLIYRQKRTVIRRRKKVIIAKNVTTSSSLLINNNNNDRPVVNNGVIVGRKRKVIKGRRRFRNMTQVGRINRKNETINGSVFAINETTETSNGSVFGINRKNKTSDVVVQMSIDERPKNSLIKGDNASIAVQQSTVYSRAKGIKTKRVKLRRRQKLKEQNVSSSTTTATTLTLNSVINSTGSFTLAAVDSDQYTTTTSPSTTTRSPMVKDIGEFLVDLVKNLKRQYGSWFHFPDIDKLMPEKAKNNGGNIDTSESVDGQKHIPLYNKSYIESTLTADDPLRSSKQNVYENLNGLLNSKIIVFKDDVDFSEDNGATYISMDPSEDKETVHMLSPRLMPLAERGDDRPTFLSPDFLSLYEKNTSNNVASMPSLLSAANMTWSERRPWLQLMGELTGAADIFRAMKNVEFSKILARANVATGDGLSLPVKQTFDILDVTLGDIYKTITQDQAVKMNNQGYATLNPEQIRTIYGDDRKDLQFNVEEFLKLSDDDKDALLMDAILAMATGTTSKLLRPFVGGTVINSIVYEEGDDALGRHHRSKRQAATCIATPFIGGSFFAFYVLNPQILCPSVFSYTIIGCYILSPYILSPYVMGPFILAPEVLSPFILSPYVLSPTILTPVVLSPGILNPLVLSPYILSPFVLSPSILSPIVLTPNILGPGVLSPIILSPAVLSPGILSPGVLNPAILSPAVLSPAIGSPSVLSPAILSPTVLNPSILSPGVLNHAVLSPGVKSPAIASPCAMCRRRRKRDLFILWLLSGAMM